MVVEWGWTTQRKGAVSGYILVGEEEEPAVDIEREWLKRWREKWERGLSTWITMWSGPCWFSVFVIEPNQVNNISVSFLFTGSEGWILLVPRAMVLTRHQSHLHRDLKTSP